MHPSDKDFDRLFREAADRFEPDDSMLSWGRLEKNLAGQLPERPPGPPRRFGFRPMVWIPAAVFIAGISFFLIKNHQPYRSLSTLISSASSAPASAPDAPDAGGSPAVNSARSGTDGTHTSGNGTGVTAAGNQSASGEVTLPATTDSGNAANALSATPTVISSADAPVRTAAGKKAGITGDTKLLITGKEKQLIPAAGNSDGTGLAAATGNQDEKRQGNRPGKDRHYGQGSAGNKLSTSASAPDDVSGQSGNKSDNAEVVRSRDTQTASWFNRPKVSDNASNLNDGNEAGSTGGSRGDEGSLDNNKAPGTVSARPEFAQTHLPGIRHAPSPFVHPGDDALKAAAAQNKSLPLPSRSVQVRQPLTFGLVMGPDYTNGGVASSQLGNSVGISLSYYLGRRLSVNSGILYEVKSYSAKGKDFQPPVNPLRAPGTYPHFESANGTVYLFEIPLSLRYDIPVAGKTRFFANAGISSYLPVRERYTTYFREQGRVYAWRQENDNPQTHWFGVGHFSAGVERDLAKGLSFQVEPYLNLPFTNVCTGNVKLNTFGLLFSIRYTPVLSRKKG